MLGTAGVHSYEEMMRALLWPNAVASASLVPHGCMPPLQHLATVCEGPGGFRVAIDVHQFAPNELTVKTKHHTVVIEGKHEERPDAHGTVTRHFVRRFVLPEEYDPDHVATSISSDGVLVIVAPKKNVDEDGVKTKTVPISVTGVPALKHHHPMSPVVHHGFDELTPAPSEHAAKPASHHQQ